jgi:hypothetical protein
MAAPHAPALDVLARQLTAALDQYEEDVRVMVESWLDLERYRRVSAEIEEIRALAAGLPQAGVQWVELLIAHAELVHCLWRLQFGNASPQAAGPGELRELRERHGACIAALRRRCRRYLPR